VRPAERAAVALWLAFATLCAVLALRAEYSTDLSAFLPRSPTPAQQILVDQLHSGAVARIVLIGIEGADPSSLAKLSAGLMRRLGKDPRFVQVENGSSDILERETGLLLRQRYILSPAVAPERFTEQGLRAGLERQLERLASPLSMVASRLLPRDPTGELFEIADTLGEDSGPDRRRGVWFGREGSRALLFAQTGARGFDIDAQSAAIAAIRSAFEQARRDAGVPSARLLLAGPGVFAVQTRNAIKNDAIRVSIVAGAAIALLLLVALRSPRLLAIIVLPVATGAVAGVAAVDLAFGSVHGVTLGFGATLLGEAVDYAIYFFARAGATSADSGRGLWRTLRLGVVTSVAGFGALLLSGFPGLAQIGLFSATGLIVALLVTRWVLPQLSPAGFEARIPAGLGAALQAATARARRGRSAAYLLLALGAGWLLAAGSVTWNDELSALSPVAASDQRLDQEMREDLGVPDVRHLIVAGAGSRERALELAEEAAQRLRPLIAAGAIAGFDSPALYLPSESMQRARRASLPEPQQLGANLQRALSGLPFRDGVFEPFLLEVAAQKRAPPMTREDLEGSTLAIRLDSLLLEGNGRWQALMPLRGAQDAPAVARALGGAGPDIVLLDLKAQADALYRDYRRRVLTYSSLGAGAIVLLLAAALRSVRRIWDVLAPLAAAVLATCIILALAGVQLTIFHVVALLLVVGVGSNYTLFFDRALRSEVDPQRTLAALLLCNLSTVIGFGAVAFARTPVLSAIGVTVAIGAALSLMFGAVLTSGGGRGTNRETQAHR
jgi:predicted exporter